MYEAHYRFKENPFRISPDPGFFFSSPAHRKALAYLRYGLARREGFIVVTGRPGTGKTTLAQTLLLEAQRERVVVGNLNTTHLEADDVLRMVAASFGLDIAGESKANTLKRLERFFASKVRAGEHVLLVVDEAQNLPHSSLEELRMLSNFQVGNHALVQIFLLGQQQFRDMLNSPELEQLRQRVVAACHLEPLTPQETRGYIEHRLRQAGWEGVPRLTDIAYGLIHAVSEGIPRRVNAFCDRLFLYGALEELEVLGEEAVQAVHQELTQEGVFDQKPLSVDDIEPVPPLEDEAPTPPSGTVDVHASGAQDEASEQQIATEAKAVDADEPRQDAPGAQGEKGAGAQNDRESSRAEDPPKPGGAGSLRERIHVYSGGGEQRDAPGVRVNEPPRPELEDNPSFPPAAYAALEAYRDPEVLMAWSDPERSLPEGMHELLRIAVGKDEAYGEAAWISLGCDRKELREAARHFVAKVLFVEGADYFRNLALDPDARDEQIKAHYRLLFRIFQPANGENDPNWSRRQVKALNRAYNTLRNGERRAAYLQRLRQQDESRLPFKTGGDAPSFADAPPADVAPPPTAVSGIAEPSTSERGVASGGHGWIWVGTATALLLLAGGLYWSLGLQQGEEGATDTVAPTTQIPVLRGDAGDDRISDDEIGALPGAPASSPTTGFSQPASSIVNGRSEERPALRSESPQGSGGAVPASTPPREVRSPAGGEATFKRSGENESARTRPVAAERPKSSSAAPPVEGTQRSALVPSPRAEENEGGSKGGASTARPESASEREAITVKVAEKTSTAATATPKTQTQTSSGRVTAPVATQPVETATQEDGGVDAPVIALSLPVLQQLMKDFFDAYARGDIEAFMGYFAPTAFTNDQTDLKGIRRDYQQLFDATEDRHMQADLSWELIDEDRARGEGRFMVSVRPKGAREARIITGSLVVQVVVGEGGRPLIGGLFHTYDRPR